MSPGDETDKAARHRVLIVEDEMLVAVTLEDMLAELGFAAAGTAANLDQALAMARQDDVDFAILDVNLDGREIYPVAEVLAERGIPFAFATGYGSRGLSDAWRDRPTLRKPFQLDRLEQVVSELLPT